MSETISADATASDGWRLTTGQNFFLHGHRTWRGYPIRDPFGGFRISGYAHRICALRSIGNTPRINSAEKALTPPDGKTYTLRPLRKPLVDLEMKKTLKQSIMQQHRTSTVCMWNSTHPEGVALRYG